MSIFEGVVTTATRRHVEVYVAGEPVLKARLLGKNRETTVGDHVIVKPSRGDFYVDQTRERKNQLQRTYFRKTKVLAANLDRIFIVGAVAPFWNTGFIDRVLVVAATENIPVTLILNKIDQNTAETDSMVSVYEACGYSVLRMSAKESTGLEALRDLLSQHQDLHQVCFTGISGVGKSSILQKLLPGKEIKTGEVSKKTGQGRQTTSQSFGYLYPSDDSPSSLVIDLPGVQNFGLTHLQLDQIAMSFPEFELARGDCQYYDCMHRAELECGVKKAVEAGSIAEFRYHSYLHIISDIEAARPY